jgi:hypothetical protein
MSPLATSSPRAARSSRELTGCADRAQWSAPRQERTSRIFIDR